MNLWVISNKTWWLHFLNSFSGQYQISKKEGFVGYQLFLGGGWGWGGGCSFYIKNKLESLKCLPTKKVYNKTFFSVITKNLNWENLTKNLVTLKRGDGVKDKKF